MRIHLSDAMVEFHRRRITLPPTIIDQCDSIANQARYHGLSFRRKP